MTKLFSGPKIPQAKEPEPLPEYKPPPEPEPVIAVPTADDDTIQRKKRKELAALSARSGRASTFLVDNESGLG